MFSYLGPHVKHREKYLKDHDHDRNNNFLQSDVVNIILNLSAIPDEVAKKLDLNYFDSYFNLDFIKYMEAYMQDFEETHNKKWTFADEEAVADFVASCRQRGWSHRTADYYQALLEDKIEYWKKKTHKSSERTTLLTTMQSLTASNNVYSGGMKRFLEE